MKRPFLSNPGRRSAPTQDGANLITCNSDIFWDTDQHRVWCTLLTESLFMTTCDFTFIFPETYLILLCKMLACLSLSGSRGGCTYWWRQRTHSLMSQQFITRPYMSIWGLKAVLWRCSCTFSYYHNLPCLSHAGVRTSSPPTDGATTTKRKVQHISGFCPRNVKVFPLHCQKPSVFTWRQCENDARSYGATIMTEHARLLGGDIRRHSRHRYHVNTTYKPNPKYNKTFPFSSVSVAM